MAGILDSITERHTDFRESKNETRQENEIQNQQGKSEASGNHEVGICSPTPAPCCCGSALAWFDIYGGGPHCHGCRPWTAESLVRSVMGYDAQETRRRVLWPIEAIGPLGTPQASCTHRRGRNLTIGPWPGCAGEVEMVWECAECGMWFEGKPAGG